MKPVRTRWPDGVPAPIGRCLQLLAVPIVGSSGYGAPPHLLFTNIWQRLLVSIVLAAIVAVVGEMVLRVVTRFRRH